jgi:large subunit ribosomal protein L15
MAEQTENPVPILSRLRPPAGAVRKKTRVGRGPGSGLGKTAGRGQKGQRARNTTPTGFEGGQMPLQRRLPKTGFKNPFKTTFAIVNVGELNAFDKGAVVDLDVLRSARLVRKAYDGLKILGDGELDRALTVKAHSFSAAAREKIEKAGGKIETIEVVVKPVVRHKNKKK